MVCYVMYGMFSSTAKGLLCIKLALQLAFHVNVLILHDKPTSLFLSPALRVELELIVRTHIN